MRGDPGDDLELPTLELGERCLHVLLARSIARILCGHSAQVIHYGSPSGDSAARSEEDTEASMGLVDRPSIPAHVDGSSIRQRRPCSSKWSSTVPPSSYGMRLRIARVP